MGQFRYSYILVAWFNLVHGHHPFIYETYFQFLYILATYFLRSKL
jgi:hypothetical protein